MLAALVQWTRLSRVRDRGVFGGSRRYTQHWLKIARFKDDRIFGLYVSLFLVDFMSDYGQVFNGNQKPLSPETHRHLLEAVADSLRKAA